MKKEEVRADVGGGKKRKGKFGTFSGSSEPVKKRLKKMESRSIQTTGWKRARRGDNASKVVHVSQFQ